MKLYTALILGKLIAYITRTLKIGGGSAAPGYYALKVEPDLVPKLIQKIPINVVITGTNGKTTTARILAHLAQESGLKVIRNHTGSNLERGIASTLIQHSTNVHLKGGKLNKLNCDLGIWELDEAAFNTVAPKLKPNVAVFLNVYRDQLDRYGETNSVVKKWCQTLEKLDKKTKVLLNGDDANTLKLQNCFKGEVKTFGVKDSKITGESLEKTGHKKPFDFEARNIKLNGLDGSDFQIALNSQFHTLHLPVPGLYHIYDALAALATATYILSDTLAHQYTDMLTNFQPAFGRVEKLPFGYIFLIKNPAGATQVFETIAPQIKKGDRLLLALNDNLADGTDVSWIWDVNFERLQVTEGRGQIYCTGTRAQDLAVRLKYAGFDPKQIIVQNDLKKALELAKSGLKEKNQLFILPTYTALLELQKILARSGVKKHYWEET